MVFLLKAGINTGDNITKPEITGSIRVARSWEISKILAFF